MALCHDSYGSYGSFWIYVYRFLDERDRGHHEFSDSYGGFLKWGYPEMDGFFMENPTKMDDWGVPLF